MTINKLIKNLEEKLQSLNKEYDSYSIPLNPDSSIYSLYERKEMK